MSLIELKNVDVFQSDRLILSDVSFSIQPSEFVYLIGATGSGKSSLLKTLYAELPMKKGLGEVVDHQLFEIKKSMIPYLRRKIGIVFQDFQLLTDRTVRDNLDFVLKATGWKDKDEIKDRIDEVFVLGVVTVDGRNFRHHRIGYAVGATRPSVHNLVVFLALRNQAVNILLLIFLSEVRGFLN